MGPILIHAGVMSRAITGDPFVPFRAIRRSIRLDSCHPTPRHKPDFCRFARPAAVPYRGVCSGTLVLLEFRGGLRETAGGNGWESGFEKGELLGWVATASRDELERSIGTGFRR